MQNKDSPITVLHWQMSCLDFYEQDLVSQIHNRTPGASLGINATDKLS